MLWDHESLDDARLAKALGASLEAVRLTRASDFVDLHVDSFIPARLWRYGLSRRHARHPLRGRFFGHLDFPRAIDAGLSGGMYSITTNPFRSRRGRWRALLRNIARMRRTIDETGGRVRVVRTAGEYDAARRDGAHACLLSIQGGNALSPDEGLAAAIPDDVVTRVTVVHLTHSLYGRSSTPYPSRRSGLTKAGEELVASLDDRRVLVDLAHAHPSTFWDVVRVHDRALPLAVTHTGVSGVRPHWRNVDDEQLRAVADTGGVVGVMFHSPYLGRVTGKTGAERVVDHIEHIAKVAGEGTPAIGTDYDGAILPAADLRDGLALPLVTEAMLRRGFSDARVRAVLGGNFLRAFRALRP